MLTQTEENYLKAIFNLETAAAKAVSTNLLSEKMKIKASSVTDMVKKLAEKEFINYKKYKGVSLTKKGYKTALKIVRKHRLWEVFLVNKLGYNWDEVHEIAEQLEHINSDSLINKLDTFLDFPAFDPHGDPIPDKNGKIIPHKNFMLSSLKENEQCVVVGVKDSSTSFLKYLNKVSIKLGNVIKVHSIEAFDNSMVIENNNVSLTVSHQISKNLFVKKL